MICSMTSFSRQAHDDEWGRLVWELRTVNHRFLEINLRCPESFRDQEMAIRNTIKQYLSRGKIDATLKFIPGPEVAGNFSINDKLLKKLSDAQKKMHQYFPAATTNAMDILSWQGVLQTVEGDSGLLKKNMLELLKGALKELVEVRQREGQGLQVFLKKNQTKIAAQAALVRQQLPEIIDAERLKLTERLSEVKDSLDPQRLEQEMLIWAQRADVAEELQRLDAHLQEVNRVLEKGGVVGRRLDFLMQELNREANTLGSKSLHARMSQAAVEMKVLIEQMREQVQNIE
jgi:uncharacterized protein (TIGR00255 family)